MKCKKAYAVFPLILLLTSVSVYANPIPMPVIMMMEEHIDAILYPAGDGYWAFVRGEYSFRNMGYSEVAMKIPVPPGSVDISVLVGGVPVYWSWSGEKYRTEIGEYGMISWTVDNPPGEFRVSVVYRHRLVGADGRHIFLYALGTGRYAEYYSKQVTAHIRLAVTGAVESYAARLGGETIDSGGAGVTLLTRSYDLQSGMFRPFRDDFIFSFNASVKPSNLQLSTDRHVYAEGEPVAFWLRNGGGETVTLRNSAPWMIVSAKHGLSVVYTPVALQAVRQVAPGETVSWTWNQRNNAGGQVPPGLYAVILEAGGQQLTAPFTIRETVEFPGRLNVTLRLYPDMATVRLDALLRERPERTEILRNLTVRIVAIPEGNRLTGTLYIDGKVDPEGLEEVPLSSLSLHIRYERPRGGGNVSVRFRPRENLPVEKAYAEFKASQAENPSLIGLNINFSVAFSKEHLKDEAAGMLEMYAAMLSTPAGKEMAKHKIEEMTGGSVKLEYLALSFSRETYVLNCTVTLKMNSSALSTLPSVVPGATEAFKESRLNMTEIAPANLTMLGLNAEYDGETGVFSGDMMIVAEGDVAAMIEKAGGALIDSFIGRSAAASILSGWLGDFRIGIHGRFDFAFSIPANTLHVSGIALRYGEEPRLTAARLIEAVSGIPMLPRNVALTFEGGSTEYEEVILRSPTGERVERIVVSGNTSALTAVTYEAAANPWRIADYSLHNATLEVGGEAYRVVAASNATATQLTAEAGSVTVKTQAPSGLTTGLNIVIPKAALAGAKPEEVKVRLNGEQWGWILLQKEENISIILAYPYPEATVQVEWPLPTPSPTLTVAAAAAAVAVGAAAIAAIIIKKRL